MSSTTSTGSFRPQGFVRRLVHAEREFMGMERVDKAVFPISPTGLVQFAASASVLGHRLSTVAVDNYNGETSSCRCVGRR